MKMFFVTHTVTRRFGKEVDGPLLLVQLIVIGAVFIVLLRALDDGTLLCRAGFAEEVCYTSGR